MNELGIKGLLRLGCWNLEIVLTKECIMLLSQLSKEFFPENCSFSSDPRSPCLQEKMIIDSISNEFTCFIQALDKIKTNKMWHCLKDWEKSKNYCTDITKAIAVQSQRNAAADVNN